MNNLRVLQLITPLLATIASAKVFDFPVSIRNSYHVVDVELGTPAKTYSLFFDTGSATTWVLDTDCANKVTCQYAQSDVRTPYDVSKSSTGQNLDIYSELEYTGGYVTGFATKDVMSIDGTQFNQDFLVANYSSWSALDADGFMGLASSSIAASNTTTVFDSILSQGLADEPRFGIFLGSVVDNATFPSPETDAVLTLGGSREDKYADGELKWAQALTPFEVYKLPLVNISMENEAVSADVPSEFSWTSQVVFDTGATDITVPAGYIDELYAQTPWSYERISSGYRPLCTEFNNTWSFTINLGVPGAEVSLSLTGEQLRSPGYVDDEHCWPPFESWESANIILGTTVLRNFYSVFDLGDSAPAEYDVKIGFAPLKDEYKPQV